MRDPHDADEALMDAAVVMYRKWPRILAHANPIALAHRILDNAITDFYRRRARTAGREVSHAELSYADMPTADDLMLLRGHDRLDRALADLDQRAPLQANCVRLRYLTELDFTEHQKDGAFPLQNGGLAPALFCWGFLLLVFFGPGSLTLMGLLRRQSAPSAASPGAREVPRWGRE
ncbi:hypothetical protein ACFPZI_30220 [Streptomyces chlorus]|uniref:DUF4349 domain-containing protein n=1 Tax=Streptomyces chlorus TaxID=887452 RepID=A0ABW1E4X1_9ACTN